MNAAIFDMDGLLIDSEPLWKEAEISVFGSLGVPLTQEMCRQTVGVRLDGVVRHWYDRYPWQGESLESVETRILDLITRLIVERGRPMPGVDEAIRMLEAENYALAVASSSPMVLIRTALEKFGIIDCFCVLHSADTEEEGKPNPAVYLSTMSLLDAKPEDCIAFEDSALGVLAAKRAGAFVIAVPEPADRTNPGFAAADLVLESLRDLSLEGVRWRESPDNFA
jgi:HAD superfamily hydrolase (TIGR01509 family)